MKRQLLSRYIAVRLTSWVGRFFSLLLLFLIRLYQWTISPLLNNTCRFAPTCSHYSYEAISRHGFIKGSWLSINRILRCHPWHPGGVDHVP